MRRRYRVKHVETTCGPAYVAQFKPWWCPVWLECFGTNFSSRLEDAIKVCERHKNRVAWEGE